MFSVLTLLKQTYPDNTVIVRNADVGLAICEEVTSELDTSPGCHCRSGYSPGARTDRPTPPARIPRPRRKIVSSNAESDLSSGLRSAL